jgi:hypothetical protein
MEEERAEGYFDHKERIRWAMIAAHAICAARHDDDLVLAQGTGTKR